jgi:hypothetical protein
MDALRGLSWQNKLIYSYMEEEFQLPVSFNNKELRFPVRLLNYGYSYKLEVTIDDTKLLFERDEERNWRALISYEDTMADKKINVDLVKAIALSIDEVLK